MLIKITPSPATDGKVKLKDGKEIDLADVASIDLEPFFSHPSALTPAVHVESRTSNGAISIESFDLVVSGSTGKSKKQPPKAGRPKVTPRVDRVAVKTVPQSPPLTTQKSKA